MKKEKRLVLAAGVAVGLAALALTALGNPGNMGFCIACFERDIAGAIGLHSAAKVQYVRPEISGLVLGAFVMIGALVFLGCPLRMVLRLGGGDLNAVVGLLGFVLGICIGIVFLRRGFDLKRSYPARTLEGTTLPAVMTGLLLLVLLIPSVLHFSTEGPGSKHAPFFIALVIAVVVGALAQKSRPCMVGGIGTNGKIAVAVGFVVLLAISLINSRQKEVQA